MKKALLALLLLAVAPLAQAGAPPQLVITAGLAHEFDDFAVTQTVTPSRMVRFGLQVTVVNSSANNVVVWLPLPTKAADPTYPFSPFSISGGGLFTSTPVMVGGTQVPANSVYWNLGDLPVGAYPGPLHFFSNFDSRNSFGATYTTQAAGSINGGPLAASALLTLIAGNQNQSPTSGAIASELTRVGNQIQVKLTCTGWTDPEGDTPLQYGVVRLLEGMDQELVVPDAGNSVMQFNITPPSTIAFLLFVRVKDSLGHVGGATVLMDLPDIAIEQPAGTNIADGGSSNLGNVGSGGISTTTFTIKNTGLTALNAFDFSMTGTDAAAFKVIPFDDPINTVLLPGAEAPFQVKFIPTRRGVHTAVLHIVSNDPDEPSFDITLTGTGVAPGTLPTAKTVAATAIASDSATLNGLVNAKGIAREIWFEYGPTTSLGTFLPATPSNLDESSDAAVTAALTGLAPHTRYHYRVRIGSPTGGAAGAVMSFTTANPLPEGVADTFQVTIASTVQLNVLQNDLSPDGDAISVLSNTALVPSTAGKLTRSGNNFIFAATSTFNGATFTYKIKDAFGGVSAPVTVTLTQGACGIDPAIADRPSAPHSYPVTVTTTAMWSANESLPWVTVSPSSGTGGGSVTVTLQANTAKTERSGTVIIGGYPHDIYQSGVSKPTLQMPDPIMEGIVAAPYSLLIPTTNFPVTYTITNMPPGLTINANSGLISGIPTKAGKYNVTVKAKNAAGSADLSPTFEIDIASLGEGVIGTFHGLVDPHPTINGNLGSRFEITTTKTGSYSGKLITGGATTLLKGVLEADPEHPNEAYCFIEFPRTGAGPIFMDLTFSHDAHSIVGTLIDSDTLETTDVHAWRNTWTTANRATSYGGLYTFVLAPTDFDPSLPQGYGFGSFKLTSDTTGAITVSGKAADGNTFTCGTFIGPYGEILVYQSLYGGKGSLAGMTSITLVATPGEHTLNNFLNWFKPAPAANSKDTLYKSGFGPLTMNVKGGRHPEIPAGGLVMNLTPGDTNARIDLAGGGLDTEGKEFGVTFSIQNPSATGKTNKAVIPTNTNKLTMPTLNAATGAFSGDFTLTGATTAQNRKVPYQGQIVRTVDGIQGFGYFILPESTAATATRRSGNVQLQQNK